MKINFLPHSRLGKWGFFLSLAFVFLLFAQIQFSLIPLPVFFLLTLGVTGFVLSIIAFVKRDRAVGTLLSIIIGAVIIFVFGSILVMSADLFKGFPVAGDYLQKAEGEDLSGDGMNFGDISQSGEQIFLVEKNRLYTINIDWTNRKEVTDFPVSSIFLSGDWIYFTNDRDVSELCKMRKDGTERTKLSEDNLAHFYVLDDYIVYSTKKTLAEFNDVKKEALNTDNAALESEVGRLYRMKTDGSEKTELCKVSLEPGRILVSEEWIYFEDYQKLCGVRSDGSDYTVISESGRLGFVEDEWFYFISVRNPETRAYNDLEIFRMKKDGSEKTFLSSVNRVSNFCFDNGWFYYVLHSEKGLYRMKPDGSEREKLNNINIWQFDGVVGNWMHITDYAGPRYRVKLDGSVGTRIN
jgi:ABC-type transport system involved in multi-copper enzyme maturation permease subunit